MATDRHNEAERLLLDAAIEYARACQPEKTSVAISMAAQVVLNRAELYGAQQAGTLRHDDLVALVASRTGFVDCLTTFIESVAPRLRAALNEPGLDREFAERARQRVFDATVRLLEDGQAPLKDLS